MKFWILGVVAVLFIASFTDLAPLTGRWMSEILDARISRQVQEEMAGIRASKVSERDSFTHRLQTSDPHDGLSLLFANRLVGNLIVGGLAVCFLVMISVSRRDDRLALIFGVIGLLGCAAVAFVGDRRMPCYGRAEEALATWSTSTGAGQATWAEVFLSQILVLRTLTVWLSAGLIAAAISLVYGLTYAAGRTKRIPVAASAPKPTAAE
jgi:hypothetical protein